MEIIGPHLGELKGGVKVDKSLPTSSSVFYDAVYVPGGKESVTTLLGEYEAKHFVREAYNHGKTIAASGDGGDLLQAVGIGKAPGVIVDNGSSDASKSFTDAISRHRHWNRPK